MNRWNVYVEDSGVKGCVGSFRWRWRARIEAHHHRRFWPGEKVVSIVEGEAP